MDKQKIKEAARAAGTMAYMTTIAEVIAKRNLDQRMVLAVISAVNLIGDAVNRVSVECNVFGSDVMVLAESAVEIYMASIRGVESVAKDNSLKDGAQ